MPSTRASIYVHFPYCLEKCPYCDFVSYKTERKAIDHHAYADAVIRELSSRGVSFFGEGRTIGSIFFGGGTPSLWEPKALGRVISAIGVKDAEITVECNPTSLDADRCAALADAGVNRLSIGVQSLRDAELKFLGRLHDSNGALAAVRAAIASPIRRVSADLIFGLPEQAPDDAARQADTLADLGLNHLSCYQLTIEPNTRFGELKKRNRLPMAEDGAVAEAFLAIEETLGARGLRHYEISNYAREGEEARHNLGYWRGEEYLGLGCGAFGFTRTRGAGVRWRNQILPETYVQNAHDPTMEREELDAEALLRERIMLGLRVREGVDLAAAGDDLGIDAMTQERKRTIDALVARGRLSVAGARLTIPPTAWLFADDTASRLM